MDNKSLDPNLSIIPTMSSHDERQQQQQYQQMKAILTKDDIKILCPNSKSTDDCDNSGPELKFLSKEVNVKNLEMSKKSSTKTPIDLRKPINVFSVMDTDDNNCLEFKLTARPVFITTICQHCKFSISTYFTCKLCQMVSYCKDEHLKIDSVNHKDLCLVIQGIAKKRGGHIYNMAGNLNGHEYKNLRIHTINLCEKFLNRQLKPFEREIFLYPRLCSVTSCREWRAELLNDCSDCRQVSYCTAHELPVEHKIWCESYALFQKLVTRQSCHGRIEPTMPHKVLKQKHQLTGSVHDLWKVIYKNTTAFKDDCLYSTMTQVATGPLTALYGYQKSQLPFKEQFTIHLVGAELQFEGSELDKWETFFLHLVPEISDLHIIFIGPELNVENLPVEIISRTRMCRLCRSNCRGVTFDFQCKKFYHDYCDSMNYSKPDMICFFNAGLYRTNSFKGFDTWPKTVEAALNQHKNIPVIVTSSAEYEAPLDLQRILSIVQNCDSINVIQEPTRNPYASIKPERNFVNEEIAPLIFKNQFYFVLQSN
jgi:splicing suppressor protein 51